MKPGDRFQGKAGAWKECQKVFDPCGVVTVSIGFQGLRSFLAQPLANRWHSFGMRLGKVVGRFGAVSALAGRVTSHGGEMGCRISFRFPGRSLLKSLNPSTLQSKTELRC